MKWLCENCQHVNMELSTNCYRCLVARNGYSVSDKPKTPRDIQQLYMAEHMKVEALEREIEVLKKMLQDYIDGHQKLTEMLMKKTE